MKILKKRVSVFYNSVITVLLTLLGFGTSCERDGSGGMVAEYGTPSAKFIINGRVASSETDVPIGDIKVFIAGDTSKTDADGKYILTTPGFPHDQSINISFQDIDGTLNGEFESSDTTAVFKDPEYINGDGHWYRGETSKVLNIKLKTKE